MVSLIKYGALSGGEKYNTNILEIDGLSTDTKPITTFIEYGIDGREIGRTNIENGSTFTEIDTGKLFMYDAENTVWYEIETSGGGGGGTQGGIVLVGETTTALTDEATTNPITVDGQSYTAQPNDAVIYGSKEFLFDGTKWHEFGDLSGLASKDIGAMTGYAKASTGSAIATTDTLNQAIGKVEKRVEVNENNISAVTMGTQSTGDIDLNAVTTNSYKMYTNTTSNSPTSDGSWYFVKTTVFDNNTMLQEATAMNAGAKTYTRIKRSGNWQAWKLSNLDSTQEAAVNSGINDTLVGQINTNQNNISKDEAALAELVDSGAKNLLKNTAPYGDNVRTNITFSHNSDDSYIINAENANTQNTDFYVATDVQIKPGTYKLSGCPAGGDNLSTYKLQIAGIGYDMGDGLTFTIVQATTINVYIRIWAGYVPNGLVFKPMICTKTAWDISQEYVPYRPSYQELYDRILALENQ